MYTIIKLQKGQFKIKFTKEEETIMNLKKNTVIKVDVEKFSSFMKDQNISQTKLSKLASVSSTTISNIFKTQETKKYITLYKIASALNINLQDIVVEEE